MFGNTQYSLLDIKYLYGYISIEATVQALWKADARLYTYSKLDVASYGLHKEVLNKDSKFIKENSEISCNKEFKITLPPDMYRLNRERLDHYFNYEKSKFIAKNTMDIIQPKIGSTTIRGSLKFDLYPENILVDEAELFATMGPPPPKDSKHPFYYAFEQSTDEWIAEFESNYWTVAKDFSYFQIPNNERVELMGLKKELFEFTFHHHCNKHGLSFKSGEVMSKLKTQHSYKGFSDFLSKNKDFKSIFIKVNNKGIWRMKFPIFHNYIQEVIIPNLPSDSIVLDL